MRIAVAGAAEKPPNVHFRDQLVARIHNPHGPVERRDNGVHTMRGYVERAWLRELWYAEGGRESHFRPRGGSQAAITLGRRHKVEVVVPMAAAAVV